MKNPESRRVLARTPHVLWYQLLTAFNSAGQVELSVMAQWDSHDVPVEVWHGHLEDFMALGKLANEIYVYRHVRRWQYIVKAAWAIVRGTDVPRRLQEPALARAARAVRRRIDGKG